MKSLCSTFLTVLFIGLLWGFFTISQHSQANPYSNTKVLRHIDECDFCSVGTNNCTHCEEMRKIVYIAPFIYNRECELPVK